MMDSVDRNPSKLRSADRYEMVFKVAYDLFDVDNAEAVRYAGDAFEMARELGDSAKIVRSGRIYGQLLRRVGKLDEAILVMEPLIQMAERQHYAHDLRLLVSSLAIAYVFRGRYDRALEFHIKSLELRQAYGDKVQIAIAHNGIGTTFYLIGIYDRAAEFFKNSLMADSVSDYATDTKVSLALCYGRLNYLKESRSLIEDIISQHRGKIAPTTLPRIEYGLGYIDLREGKLHSARVHFESGYRLATLELNKICMSDCLAKLGDIYLRTGALDLAEQYLQQSDSFANQIGYRNGREVANLSLAKLYSLKNDHTNASIVKSNIIAIKDSSINQGVIENIFRHQFDYYQKQNKKTIATQAELLILQEQAIKQHLISNIISWTCAALLVAVVVLLYRSNNFKKQITNELESRVQERTAELRLTVDSLQHAHLERNFMIDGIARRLNANIATLKGLGVVAATYEEIPEEFVRNMDMASDLLARILPQLARSKK
jgi:tetratricopeptide (TPR) repeat protein